MNLDVFQSRREQALPDIIKVIRHADVCKKLGISAASLFEMISRGDFPKPFPIIPQGRSVGWLESEVDAWIMQRALGGAQ